MTQDERRICAERLFDEIGLIDDRFIVEAASPYIPAKKSAGVFKRLLISAVSLALVACIALGIFIIGRVGQKSDSDIIPEDDFANSGSTDSNLSEKLVSMRGQTEELRVKEADLRLFSGTPSVIWKYSDEEEYRICTISAEEEEGLRVLLTKNKGSRVDEHSTPRELEGLWITSGDGSVISPYLEQTEGNVGYGEVFEYSPEYEPSKEFSDYLCDVIS